MNTSSSGWWFTLGCSLVFSARCLMLPVSAQSTTAPSQIDLPTALRLAGAQNLDVKIARERMREANANHQSALARFFPWIAPGISYHRRDGMAQAVPAGTISDTHLDSYSPGATLSLQLDLGDALYKSLASKQLASAATHALEAQRQNTVLAAAQDYFELARAQGAVGVAIETVRISSDYEAQVGNAVEAGIAFKGDLLRARLQVERNRQALRQSREQQRVAAARLAQVLRLDSTVELVTPNADLAPLTLQETNVTLNSLVASALESRPELKQNAALVLAARETRNGVTYGPLIPTVGAQGFWGGLGGGHDDGQHTFGAEQDYLVGASWKIGPGGLFDFTRRRAAESSLESAKLTLEKLRDQVTSQTVEAFSRWQSLGDQLESARRALAAAEEGFRLAQQRKEFAVGIVLETIQAEQDLTRARLDYLRAIAEYDAAQYELAWATGTL